MDRSASKKILSVLVSVLAWILLVGAANTNLGAWYATLHGDMKPTEWLTQVIFKYELPAVALGLVLVWGATKLWTGWRLGMGFVALFFAINAARQAFISFRWGEDGGVGFANRELAFRLCEAILLFTTAIALLIWHRQRNRGAGQFRPSTDAL